MQGALFALRQRRVTRTGCALRASPVAYHTQCPPRACRQLRLAAEACATLAADRVQQRSSSLSVIVYLTPCPMLAGRALRAALAACHTL
jgi:hypothetical protein